MQAVELRAPAKVNLHLGIYEGRDQRGYHRADSLMVALDIYDEVRVSLAEDGLEAADVAADAASDVACAEKEPAVPHVTCEPPLDLPAYKNTVYRAAVELATRVGREPRVHILVRKHLPDQAGLGGSSADAAAVLLALCALWGVDAHDPLVAEAARAVGADVPFFLDPVPTLLTGAGDVVAQKFARPQVPLPVVLVRPQGPGVSTPLAYRTFDEAPSVPRSPETMCELLSSGHVDAPSLAPLLYNNLDPVACALRPPVAEVRAWLLSQDGILGGQVSGSGSCVFALATSDEVAVRVADAARNIFGAWAKAVHTA